ncbi:hypothetical protein FOQG_04621 [Fusarium oxysporum f. sp. raphani 54005]|uniref:Uncharacterized protein n=4 Tax=Fusarium oxysporum TaxID=5507 RepID=X0CTF6_FUSOX|nr:hypothetical protein FOXG_19173 [Fusarium oxysporum f. sp. lycopersici 4287]EXA47073.1 hypothetical protein FOVG_04320 [Fusarium oxysporum f. sp. pisi HDV247]EXK33240.1 hypothetical protein FOMG_11981 [Fusarium oxysporum f. sp. melonis 26406]EXK94608.1 hypothetical protein FOQG_04621 [Fusarium oxysporum f. sp. raphani 54005]KAJ0142121.1 Sexual development regulator velC [Fusarium oxysporum f. sp. albedinis]KNB03658.1 hypothetical protein FOXG_19173 [Fusarium oxysporum f. sp. lycopersici 428
MQTENYQHFHRRPNSRCQHQWISSPRCLLIFSKSFLRLHDRRKGPPRCICLVRLTNPGSIPDRQNVGSLHNCLKIRQFSSVGLLLGLLCRDRERPIVSQVVILRLFVPRPL